MPNEKKRRFPCEVNLTISHLKKRKKEQKSNCVIHCQDKTTDPITNFSAISRKTVYNAAVVRKDENAVHFLDSFGEDLPGPEHGFHRKCYQVYTLSKTLKNLSAKAKGVNPC